MEYSTTEIQEGQWLDGKNLYHITIEVDPVTDIPTASINTNNDFSHGIANIDTPVKFECFSFKADATNGDYIRQILQEGTSRSYVQDNVYLINRFTRSIVRFRRAANASDEADVIYLTLWYTKTTD